MDHYDRNVRRDPLSGRDVSVLTTRLENSPVRRGVRGPRYLSAGSSKMNRWGLQDEYVGVAKGIWLRRVAGEELGRKIGRRPSAEPPAPAVDDLRMRLYEPEVPIGGPD